MKKTSYFRSIFHSIVCFLTLSRTGYSLSLEGQRRRVVVAARDRLDDALESLSLAGRYNVVLQGMLQRPNRGVLAKEAWPLLEEMVSKDEKIVAETRAALVNAAARLEDAVAMEETIRLVRKTGPGRVGANKYSSERVSGVQLPPTDPRRRAELLKVGTYGAMKQVCNGASVLFPARRLTASPFPPREICYRLCQKMTVLLKLGQLFLPFLWQV